MYLLKNQQSFLYISNIDICFAISTLIRIIIIMYNANIESANFALLSIGLWDLEVNKNSVM